MWCARRARRWTKLLCVVCPGQIRCMFVHCFVCRSRVCRGPVPTACGIVGCRVQDHLFCVFFPTLEVHCTNMLCSSASPEFGPYQGAESWPCHGP